MTFVRYLLIYYLLTSSVFVKGNSYKIVCYYTNWAQYRQGIGKFVPDNIDPYLCTHIIYAFAKLDGTKLTPLEWNDEQMYPKVNELKKKNKGLKTLMAVGGWNAGSRIFSEMVATQTGRRAFINSTIEFLRKYDFDGLDLDWEYPAGRGGVPADKRNFALLVMELKKRFRDKFLLTAAVPVGKTNIDHGYEIPIISVYLDFINLMAYDIHGSWEKVTGENAPLYPRSTEQGDSRYLNVEWAANYWTERGVPEHKLIIGLATYGRSFTLSDPKKHNIGASVRGAGQAGKFTRTGGFLSYYEICMMQANHIGIIHRDKEQKVPYYVNGNLWVGFDDINSIIIKTKWLMQKGYGGAMIWSLDLDDFNKACPMSHTNYPLLGAINAVLNGRSTTNTSTTTISSGTTKTTISTTSGTTKTSTTIPTTTTEKSQNFSCDRRKDGYYPDPKSKHRFYICAGGIQHHMTCPTGTVYNPVLKTCVWGLNVISTFESARMHDIFSILFCLLFIC